MSNITVRLLTGRASEDGVQQPGDEISVPADEARRLLESGQAEPVATKRAAKTEKRVTTPAETR